MIDRLPPQSLEAEQSVLGAILIDRDAIIEVAEFLRPDDFYRQANSRIYAAMLDLFERREPIDIVTVAEALERSEELEAVGGRAYLSSLSNETPTAVHAAQYARIVERKAVLRNLIGAAGRIAGIGYEFRPLEHMALALGVDYEGRVRADGLYSQAFVASITIRGYFRVKD